VPFAAVALAALLGAAPPTRAARAAAAVATLEHGYYRGDGRWNACLPARACGSLTSDWGADSLSGALFFRWRLTRDPSVVPLLRALAGTATRYGTCVRGSCGMWSDVPLWDAVAAARMYEATGDRGALAKAERAFAFVDRSDAFALGACPQIDFQQPAGGTTALKTLETDSNYIRAALLLARWTGDPAYLAKARAKYAAVRRAFLDPVRPLYTVYLFDDGATCAPVPGRYFASVNGNMIAAGLALAALTGAAGYRREALATAHAVAGALGDPSGVYADLQADNDVAGPLVEAMYDLAGSPDGSFARRWLLAAAAAATPGADGAYERFFDGPPPAGPVSAWSADGGLELAIAAGALDPSGPASSGSGWSAARFIPHRVTRLPAQIRLDGRAIALIGPVGDVCCEPGHLRVRVDGHETIDTSGIWQNKSPAGRRLPNSVLFAWRWPAAGRHTLELLPGSPNAKEGGAYVDLTGYKLIP